MTTKPKNYLVLIGLLTVTLNAQAAQMDKNGVLRNADGSPRVMTQMDAIKACPAGTHLPTAREVANANQSSGAKIRETYELAGPRAIQDLSPEPLYDSDNREYKLIRYRAATCQDCALEGFYIDNSNVPVTAGEKVAYWTASKSSDNWKLGYVDSNDGRGDLFLQKEGSLFPVRCAHDNPSVINPNSAVSKVGSAPTGGANPAISDIKGNKNIPPTAARAVTHKALDSSAAK